MKYPIKVNYQYTSNMIQARDWLCNLPDIFAADFETASSFTYKDKEVLKYRVLHGNYDREKQRQMKQAIVSDGLSYPSLTTITHLSVAWSNRDAYVIVCDRTQVKKLVCLFLVETEKKQIWHNASFDFGRIYYIMKKVPKNYIDTQLLSKCLLNNVDSTRDRTGLKDLMAYAYGDWAVSKDVFTLEEMWDENLIRYAATDACATYKLYEDLQEELNRKEFKI